MLALHWETLIQYCKKIQKILHTIMCAPLFFPKWFGSWNKEVKYIRQYILYFPLLWVVNFADYYSSIKDE